ncbi:MAG: hypothetical protein K5787_07470 [Lentisphaeria bacterium]|nr:hypothetical protein [Lentisphaeria bacterium]
MDNWLKRYKILGGILFACLALLLLLHILVIRPNILDAKDMRDELVGKEKRLSKSKWPMQKESLEKILAEGKARLEGKDGLKAQSEAAMKLSCSALKGRMTARGYDKTSDFMGGVLNSQFQQEFSEMQTRFEQRGVYVAPEVLNLSQKSKSKYNYQLLLQCWCVDMLADMVEKSGLHFRTHETIQAMSLDGKRKGAALISVQPVTAFVLEEKKEGAPFLLEFPVRLGVEGTLEQVTTFLQLLNVSGQFFGVRGFEIVAPPPAKSSGGQGDTKVETLQLNIECSAFLRI